MNGYTHKEIIRLLGRAIHGRQMIADGDHILVSVSGGKDSLSLLWLLRERISRVPIDYRLTAVHVDPGFGSSSGKKMGEFFETHGFEYRIIESDCGPKAHSSSNLENPCFLCSRLRRKAVFKLANELKCNKIAFGHHKDDIIETFFLNIFYGASISTMIPVQPFFGGKVVVIRPLYMIEEKALTGYAASMGWAEIPLGCPTAGSSKREEIKKILAGLYKKNRKVKGNTFHALHNVRTDYLL